MLIILFSYIHGIVYLKNIHAYVFYILIYPDDNKMFNYYMIAVIENIGKFYFLKLNSKFNVIGKIS